MSNASIIARFRGYVHTGKTCLAETGEGPCDGKKSVYEKVYARAQTYMNDDRGVYAMNDTVCNKNAFGLL